MTVEYGRREFISTALTVCAALASARSVLAAEASVRAHAGMNVIAMLRDPASAAVVGCDCARHFPAATVDSHLEALDREMPGLFAALGAGDVASARRIVAGRSRRDFDTGDVMDVNGWVLSATEARLYAFAALLGKGA